MKYPSLIACLLLIVLMSCIKETGSDQPTPSADETDFASVQVPDGFDYEMSSNETVSVSFSTGSSRVASDEVLQYAVIGVNADDSSSAFYVGAASISGGINISVNRPMHIEQMYLYTKYAGNARYFELTGEALALSVDDLIVSDEFFQSGNARTSSTPSCTSFLGNATQIRCKDNAIIIKSSASISHIDLVLNAGTTIRTYPDTYSQNADQNQWLYDAPVNGNSLNSVRYFKVYADCQEAPHTVSEQLVTFENPCQVTTVDSDEDGIPDANDVMPSNPGVSSVTYIPAYDEFSSYAFEDMWPYLGDYDFNDLVVSHNASVFTNADGNVTLIFYKFMIRAIGANFDNDFCVTIPDKNHRLVIDSISTSGLTYERVNLTGLTEIRFKHVHQGFKDQGYVNTDTTRAFEAPIDLKFTVTLDGTIALGDFEIDEFIRVDQQEGREVHKPGRKYTSLFDTSLLGYAADDTKPAEGKYFKTENNLPWAIEIPEEWEYPKENIVISAAYPNFVDYAQGKSSSPWYTDASGNKVHKNLYKRPNK